MQNPIALFSEWFAEAKAHGDIRDATAMTLATATKDGVPSARIVLLKQHDENGFVFYTNFTSRKSAELKANPKASLCFFWVPLDKQVRIDGSVAPVSDAEADAYFNTRDRGKQVGAWASLQSQPLASREDLERRIAEVEMKYQDKPIPRPPHWSGWCVTPYSMEFWQQGDSRLHQRDLYTRSKGKSWEHTLLYP